MSVTKNIKIIVIGGSAGSYSVIGKILSSIPKDFSLPVILCLHRLKEVRNGFVESLNISSRLEVKEPLDKEPVKPGFIYLSPANYHLMIEPAHTFALSIEEDINYSRPSIDVAFETISYSYRGQMAGILLSGANGDGARGLYQAYRNGAYTVIQDPKNAYFKTMPEAALKYFTPNLKVTDDEIVSFISSFKNYRYA